MENLTNLRVLNLTGNKFETIPDFVGNLKKLEELNLSGNHLLKELPDSIGNLTNLRILNISRNKLQTIPDSIGNLKKLEKLDLSSNNLLNELPDTIGNLNSLEILNLSDTCLNSLPESMENLTNLENLFLSKHNTGRRSSPDNYSQNWYYNIIQRSFEQRSCPPLASDKWSKTSFLDLSKKKLKQIPFGIHWITNLTKLDVSDNKLIKIPLLLIYLWHLKDLYIHNNPTLNSLPNFLWNMVNLKKLKIDGKLIKDLPEKARITLEDDNLEDKIVDLTLVSKNNVKMSDEALAKKTGPYTVYLK